MRRIAIVGAGYTAFRPVSPEVSFREMIFEAATKAYADVGIAPPDVDTFVSVSEDYLEGTAIADEYVPDQLGAVLKPVQTIAADGITGLASAVLQLETGEFNFAVVEGRSKASNILYPAHIEAFALEAGLRPPPGVPSQLRGRTGDAGLSGKHRQYPRAGRASGGEEPPERPSQSHSGPPRHGVC